MRLDWKFWLVLAATLAGVLVPVWLWRADLGARSLHFRKISQTSLQPPDAAKTLDLRVSLAGAELSTPFLTVLELTNDGAKPVPSSDFETPIEVSPSNKATIVRASVTGTMPRELTPSLSVEAGAMRMKPLLLNPGDSITIAVLTTGEPPVLISRARVAGVSSVPILDEQIKSRSPVLLGLAFVAALLCFVTQMLVVDGWPSRGVSLRPRAAFAIFVPGSIGGVSLLNAGLEAFGIEGFWPLAASYAACVIVAAFVAAWLNRSKQSSIETGRSAA